MVRCATRADRYSRPDPLQRVQSDRRWGSRAVSREPCGTTIRWTQASRRLEPTAPTRKWPFRELERVRDGGTASGSRSRCRCSGASVRARSKSVTVSGCRRGRRTAPRSPHSTRVEFMIDTLKKYGADLEEGSRSRDGEVWSRRAESDGRTSLAQADGASSSSSSRPEVVAQLVVQRAADLFF